MAWEPSARQALNTLRRKGVVAVRYRSDGCETELEVLSDCTVSRGHYEYSPFSAIGSKRAGRPAELFSELPLGAEGLLSELRKGKEVRVDYSVGGMAALPFDSKFEHKDLQGDCGRATHLVSRVVLGGFALAAGERRFLDGRRSVFDVPAPTESAGVHYLQHEGDAHACRIPEQTAENPRCAVPLRIGLLPLGDATTRCAPGSRLVASQCVLSKGASADTGRMVRVPEGPLCKDCVGLVRESRQHVPSFEIDVTEVTVREYSACVRAEACTPAASAKRSSPHELCNGSREDRADHPINCVDWRQAKAFCSWAGKRLPTVDEWEYAARGSEGRGFPLGQDVGDRRLCWGRTQGTCKVAAHPDGDTPLGVKGLADNVAEWTADWYAHYRTEANLYCVYWGIAWHYIHDPVSRVAMPNPFDCSLVDPALGFRCAR